MQNILFIGEEENLHSFLSEEELICQHIHSFTNDHPQTNTEGEKMNVSKQKSGAKGVDTGWRCTCLSATCRALTGQEGGGLRFNSPVTPAAASN